jgi:hypothetical protein
MNHFVMFDVNILLYFLYTVEARPVRQWARRDRHKPSFGHCMEAYVALMK